MMRRLGLIAMALALTACASVSVTPTPKPLTLGLTDAERFSAAPVGPAMPLASDLFW